MGWKHMAWLLIVIGAVIFTAYAFITLPPRLYDVSCVDGRVWKNVRHAHFDGGGICWRDTNGDRHGIMGSCEYHCVK